MPLVHYLTKEIFASGINFQSICLHTIFGPYNKELNSPYIPTKKNYNATNLCLDI